MVDVPEIGGGQEGTFKECRNNYIFKVHYEVRNKVANLPSFEYVAMRAGGQRRRRRRTVVVAKKEMLKS